MEETKTKEYRVFNGSCPHCKAHIHTDYELVPKVRKYRFDCPGCGQEIKVDRKESDNLEVDDAQQEVKNDKPKRKRKRSA